MTTPPAPNDPLALLQGTLDMLILRTLLFGPAHGHQIATTIAQTSDEVLQIDHGSLYPALHRLQRRGWIRASWGTSDNNRRARFSGLTPAGRRQLVRERSRWDRMVSAIARIMQVAE